jgi:hypothetical protein
MEDEMAPTVDWTRVPEDEGIEADERTLRLFAAMREEQVARMAGTRQAAETFEALMTRETSETDPRPMMLLMRSDEAECGVIADEDAPAEMIDYGNYYQAQYKGGVGPIWDLYRHAFYEAWLLLTAEMNFDGVKVYKHFDAGSPNGLS